MKFYFSTSISQLDKITRQNCQQICETLLNLGHKLISDKVYEYSENHYHTQTSQQKLDNYRKITQQKKQADICIFEVTNPSLGVGQEISLALSLNKIVIIFHQENHKPHILEDFNRQNLIIIPYNSQNLSIQIKQALQSVSRRRDVRFNLMLPPDINTYLNKISEERNLPKATFVRVLIKQHMQRNDFVASIKNRPKINKFQPNYA